MDAVRSMKETIPDELVRLESPPMANWLEGYMSMETHALARFGKWQALIDTPLPDDPELYCMTSALSVPEERHIHVVTCEQILGVAREMLAGEIAYHKGEHDKAFKHLRQAVENEDNLPYGEPWGWMMPSRHALGALLLEQGHIEEATAAYEADLGLDDTCIRSNRHPSNVWPLLGLHECYTRLGKHKEARMIKPELDVALSRSDKIHASCFCSMKKAA